MTESIFDPTGPETEHSGTRNLGPDAINNSHLPPEVADGVAKGDLDHPNDEDADTNRIAEAERERDSERSDKTRPT